MFIFNITWTAFVLVIARPPMAGNEMTVRYRYRSAGSTGSGKRAARRYELGPITLQLHTALRQNPS